jgi:hypothetical protein
MNKKSIITVYLILIAIIVLVVPFQYSFNVKAIHRTEYYGYSFIFKPPVKMYEVLVPEGATFKEAVDKFLQENPPSGPDIRWKTEIIYSRIGLELIAVSAFCGILYLNTKNKE